MLDAERTMARAAARLGVLALVPAVALATILRDVRGGATAAAGVLLVAGNFWITGR